MSTSEHTALAQPEDKTKSYDIHLVEQAKEYCAANKSYQASRKRRRNGMTRYPVAEEAHYRP